MSLSCEICAEKIGRKENKVVIQAGSESRHFISLLSSPVKGQVHADCLKDELQLEEYSDANLGKLVRNVVFEAAGVELREVSQ